MNNEEHMQNQFDEEKFNQLYKEIRQLTVDIRTLKNMLIILFILNFISFIWIFD
ncbi:MAG: hypothetical protein HDT39_15345 [Lachnospiraceae bacterium]|nr:hypothetical protein [Lachnospiraceae bacterium]